MISWLLTILSVGLYCTHISLDTVLKEPYKEQNRNYLCSLILSLVASFHGMSPPQRTGLFHSNTKYWNTSVISIKDICVCVPSQLKTEFHSYFLLWKFLLWCWLTNPVLAQSDCLLVGGHTTPQAAYLSLTDRILGSRGPRKASIVSFVVAEIRCVLDRWTKCDSKYWLVPPLVKYSESFHTTISWLPEVTGKLLRSFQEVSLLILCLHHCPNVSS